MNSFCLQRIGLEVLMKVASRAESLAPSIITQPFLCSSFWRSFLISVRQKASKEMKTLLKAILKFYTTNQLFKQIIAIIKT